MQAPPDLGTAEARLKHQDAPIQAPKRMNFSNFSIKRFRFYQRTTTIQAFLRPKYSGYYGLGARVLALGLRVLRVLRV